LKLTKPSIIERSIASGGSGAIVLLVVGTAFEATITHFFAKGMWSA
jgi:hypothetical protein